MVVSMVTGSLLIESPLKVNVDNAPMPEMASARATRPARSLSERGANWW
jgi:hypothetical protein